MDIIGILVLVISFFFLLVVGVPVAYSIGVAGILTMLVNIDSLPALTTYAMRMASGLDSFALLAIPFFILAGNIGFALRKIPAYGISTRYKPLSRHPPRSRP